MKSSCRENGQAKENHANEKNKPCILKYKYNISIMSIYLCNYSLDIDE